MTILPAADFGTVQNFFDGVLTKTLISARWIKWRSVKVNRSRFCSVNNVEWFVGSKFAVRRTKLKRTW
jgi:hypothetical protein